MFCLAARDRQIKRLHPLAGYFPAEGLGFMKNPAISGILHILLCDLGVSVVNLLFDLEVDPAVLQFFLFLGGEGLWLDDKDPFRFDLSRGDHRVPDF
jgi:hypothetical protein